MLGAIAGDIIGSVYEHYPIKTTQFPLLQDHSRFTDDTVLTVAIASAILDNVSYAEALQSFGSRYPNVGYGSAFIDWIFEPNPQPYNSWGNGSAMRVSPVGFAFDSVEEILREAQRTAEVSHNHPEGIKGAQATALAVFLARKGEGKETIRSEIARRFGYDLNRNIEAIRPNYHFEVSCQKSVPEALIAFLDSRDFEDAVRLAISLGGDSDTLACIAGGVAQAYYKDIPRNIVADVRERLPDEFLAIVDRFDDAYVL